MWFGELFLTQWTKTAIVKKEFCCDSEHSKNFGTKFLLLSEMPCISEHAQKSKISDIFLLAQKRISNDSPSLEFFHCAKSASFDRIYLGINFIKRRPFAESMEYRKMLEQVRKGLPEVVFEKERFEIPKAKGHMQGNKTVVNNFLQIASTLRRDPNHLLKYVLKELAAPGEVKKSGSLIFGTKIQASRLNIKIRQYAHEFVLCSECGKPDTKIEKEGDFLYMKCTACGARHPIKSKI